MYKKIEAEKERKKEKERKSHYASNLITSYIFYDERGGRWPAPKEHKLVRGGEDGEEEC